MPKSELELEIELGKIKTFICHSKLLVNSDLVKRN
jgi:hypothetical protein